MTLWAYHFCYSQTVTSKYLNENLFEHYPKAFAEAENAGAEVIVIKAAKPGVFSEGQNFLANSSTIIDYYIDYYK